MLLPPSLTCRWDKAADIRKHCQILWDILTSAQTTKKSEKKLQTRRGKSILPTLGTIVAMPAYARNPRKMKVMQQIIGVQLWLGGAKREVGNRLNMINLCQGMDVTLATINNLIKDSAKEVYTCKDAVAKNFRRPPSRRRLFTEVDEDGKWIDKDDQSVPLSYSIVFDNVNQKTHAWHQSHTRKNHMLNMVQAYAAKDRIVSLHLSCQDPHPDSILEIPPENYLPDDADVEMLRHEFCSAIGNILHQHTGNLPPNPPEPEKPFHVESSQKSELVPLGILKKMSKAEEMVDTMRDYHQYVLERPDGHPFVLPLWCDGLSSERGHDAHVSVFNARSNWSHLPGLAPSVQEWHKRQLHMEDTWKGVLLYRQCGDDGLQYNLRNVLGLTNVEADVTNCMNEAQYFCNTILDGYVMGSAMELSLWARM